ncbi:hypothetical protein [Alkalihalobacillus deserti]|uniref:hypothetical protein n=1 Tax=Alkalihalobacillus deserti TaxID=2879466 RepID=UPI00355674FF
MIGIMIQGTSSDVEKSLICTALYRTPINRGLRVATFKSQNTSNHSYVTKDGGVFLLHSQIISVYFQYLFYTDEWCTWVKSPSSGKRV